MQCICACNACLALSRYQSKTAFLSRLAYPSHPNTITNNTFSDIHISMYRIRNLNFEIYKGSRVDIDPIDIDIMFNGGDGKVVATKCTSWSTRL